MEGVEYMSRKVLICNISIGALIGVGLSLFNKGVRTEIGKTCRCAKKRMSEKLKEPVYFLEEAKQCVDDWKITFDEQTNQLVNALTQVEDTVGKLTKKE